MKQETPPLPKRTRRPSSKPRQSVRERNLAAHDPEHLEAVAAYIRAAVSMAVAVVTKDETPAHVEALAASIAAVKLARLNATTFWSGG
jgi:hypothetical protein